MRGFMPKFWFTEQMLHMLTRDESSLEQLSAYSLLMFSLHWSKTGTIFISRSRSWEENIQWDEEDMKTMSLDKDRDMRVFTPPNFLSHVLKSKRPRVLNYSISFVFMMPRSLASVLHCSKISCTYCDILFLSSISVLRLPWVIRVQVLQL